MPDVDEAVRLLTKACTTDFHNKDDASKKVIINKFLSLPKENRPVMTRKKTDSQIGKRKTWRLQICCKRNGHFNHCRCNQAF